MAYKKGNKKFWFAVIFAMVFMSFGAVMQWMGLPIDDVTLNILITVFMGYIVSNLFEKTYQDLLPESAKTPPLKTINANGEEVVMLKEKPPMEGWKKFVYSLIIGIYVATIVFVLNLYHKAIDPNFLELVSWVYLGFLFGNLYEKYSDFIPKLTGLFKKK